MKKKIVALCLVVGLLAVSVIGGTLAYFTDNDEVANTFTVGNIDILLDEAETDLYGKIVLNDEETPVERVHANEYKLIPGHVYSKDPVVTVETGSEPCYLYIQIKNDLAADLVAEGENSIAKQLADHNWKAVEGQTGIYVYAVGEDAATVVDARAAAKTLTVFENIETKTDATFADVGAEAGNQIVINAFAHQSDDVEIATAQAAAVAHFIPAP